MFILDDGFCGFLWTDLKKNSFLHRYFIYNPDHLIVQKFHPEKCFGTFLRTLSMPNNEKKTCWIITNNFRQTYKFPSIYDIRGMTPCQMRFVLFWTQSHRDSRNHRLQWTCHQALQCDCRSVCSSQSARPSFLQVFRIISPSHNWHN